MKRKAVLPPTYLLVALVLMALLHLLIPLVRFVSPPWNLLGIIPLACGIALNLFADSAFHQAETTVKPFETPSVLVTTGVFRISRNPMYLGYVLILIGVGLLLRSLTPFAVIPVFGLLMDRVSIQAEEQVLQGTFGAAWQSYAGQVRRWI
ncbi:MAG TPA: isoprenylcysteine carboxylmethyltransferase family protein [Anaerolineae bacterium]|nr:isoprenylcysteine carboxylmethyltransferase family protein [Anaerolineae bacterium]